MQMNTPEQARLHFQTSLRVVSEDSKISSIEIIKCIRSWIVKKEEKENGIFGKWFFEGGKWTNHDDSTVYVETAVLINNEELISWSLFYQEPDRENRGRRFWYTDIGINNISSEELLLNIRVSNAINYEYLGKEPNAPEASVPRFLRGIFKIPCIKIFSGSLELSEKHNIINPGFVDQLEFAIFNSNRKVPVIVINGSFNAELFPVDANQVQHSLISKAQVYHLEDNPEIAEEMRLCLGKRYACGYQNVRVYMPRVNPEMSSDLVRHRYYTSNDIISSGTDLIYKTIPLAILSRFSAKEPKSILTLSDVHDKERAILLDKYRKEGSHSAEYTKLLEEENKSLLHSKNDYERELENEIANLESKNGSLIEENDKLKATKGSLLAIKSRATDSNITFKNSFLKIYHDSREISTKDCLHALEFLYDNKIRILPSAYISAEESSGFIHVKKLWDLFKLLAGDYHQLMSEGGNGDNIAKQVFGSSFAAQESDRVKNSQDLLNLRVFKDEDQSRTMLRHLKIGNKTSISETIRVHFDWDNESRKVVIGYCGEHLAIE